MKRTISRWAVLTASALAALVLCLWGQAEFDWLGSDWQGPTNWIFLLLWPGIILAGLGFAHTWTVIPAGALLATFLLAWFMKSRRWIALAAVAGVLALGYCLVGRAVFAKLSVPTRTNTPYAADSDAGFAYREGYVSGVAGRIVTYRFRPQDMTRGFYSGMADGLVVYNRMLGRSEIPALDAYPPKVSSEIAGRWVMPRTWAMRIEVNLRPDGTYREEFYSDLKGADGISTGAYSFDAATGVLVYGGHSTYHRTSVNGLELLIRDDSWAVWQATKKIYVTLIKISDDPSLETGYIEYGDPILDRLFSNGVSKP